MARDIEQVNNAVMTNAESVGQELRVRSQAMATGCVGVFSEAVPVVSG